MSFDGFTDEAFDFYEGLTADNSKTYWTANKHVYERSVRGPMQALLETLAARFDGDPHLFRPYRDVRFSTDKSPYKTQQGGLLEVAEGIGYWISLDAEGIRVGGGFHAHDKAQTARFRAAVHSEVTGNELVTLTAKLIKTGYALGGDKVKTRPRGVDADHPRLDLMRHENLTVVRPVPHEESTSPDFADALSADWKRIKPLVTWCLTNAAPSA
jgi:uncharacterized protein (TIGR02453 family)